MKPFVVGELLARLRAMLRRQNNAPATFKVGDLTLDSGTRSATRGGHKIELSTTEYTLAHLETYKVSPEGNLCLDVL